MEKLSKVCWVPVKEDSDFSIHNLPYGIFSADGVPKTAGVAIGDYIMDLNWFQLNGYFNELQLPEGIFRNEYLNDFIGTGKENWTALRTRIQSILTEEENSHLLRSTGMYRQDMMRMHIPVRVGDYTDFYSSEEHATNVGTMFRGKDNALMPNWKHMPVAYHGRASSIIVSGQPIHRPKGQMMPPDSEKPVFGPSRLLDIELEMAFIVGKDSSLGQSISTEEAEDHLFGMVIFNDWSARDIQKWEYVPLGPFLGKNFASSISPWVVTMDALDQFRTHGPQQDPKVLPYLEYDGDKSYDIELEVYLQPNGGEPFKITKSNHKYLYWTMAQQLAHHTVNGCNINIGDLCASGTISGPTPDSYGSLLELTWRGEKPIRLPDGSERKFLEDHDTVIMKAYCRKNEIRIGFGEVKTQLLPAL